MGKSLFIAEKPSVARQFADALGLQFHNRDGYMESENTIVTWCVGHLVTMSYPDAYDEKYKKWSLEPLPFIPGKFRYQVIDSVKKQYKIVASLLTSKEVETIYICTDSGREGEYIYRLVAQQAGVSGKRQLRVWIDSQTKEEIIRGIKQAKDDGEYNNLSSAAYLRAKEDYLMGINFSRAISLKYAGGIRDFLGMDHCVIAVGRVMTCVLGIIVAREREIRAFVKTPFYRVAGNFCAADAGEESEFQAEWSVSESSIYYQSPKLYKDNGFKEKEDALQLIRYLTQPESGMQGGVPAKVEALSKKKETRNPPLLYNLAELQNDCSRYFKISPDQTLDAAQTLYERRLTTYPRTDARVLSSAVAKEIRRNLGGISQLPMYADFVSEIRQSGRDKTIAKTRYTDDKAITDHYAIIPTGQGLSNLASLPPVTRNVYELIVRRFLSVFYPPAVFDKISLAVRVKTELFQTSVKTLREPGYLKVLSYSFQKEGQDAKGPAGTPDNDAGLKKSLPEGMRKGSTLALRDLSVKEGETTPPKRYNSGSMILTMENAGQFIEDEDLREQIRGSGIGTSATRAEILKKLVTNQYIALNTKTQIYTPTQLGEMIYDTVSFSLRPLLDPKLTASWEMGLTRVAQGEVTENEYMEKLSDFISRRTNHVKQTDYRGQLHELYVRTAAFYPKKMNFSKSRYSRSGRPKTVRAGSAKKQKGESDE